MVGNGLRAARLATRSSVLMTGRLAILWRDFGDSIRSVSSVIILSLSSLFPVLRRYSFLSFAPDSGFCWHASISTREKRALPAAISVRTDAISAHEKLSNSKDLFQTFRYSGRVT